MRLLAWLCLATLTSSPATAAQICRDATIGSFGSAVSSPTTKAYLIQDDCPPNRLTVRAAVPLTVHLSGTVAEHHQEGPKSSTVPTATHDTPRWVVLFDLDKSNLDSSDLAVLDSVPTKASVRVDGYTCRLGTEPYNQDLSQRRADVVASYLKKRGVTVLVRTGHGEADPVSETNLALNRRAVVVEMEVKK